MRVYIAAPWACKSDAALFQLAFEQAGYTVTSHWISRHVNSDPSYEAGSFESRQHEALEDLRDIDSSDVFVIFNLGKSEGKATEFGYAIASNKPVLLVGKRDLNIFYYHPNVRQVDTLDEALRQLMLFHASF